MGFMTIPKKKKKKKPDLRIKKLVAEQREKDWKRLLREAAETNREFQEYKRRKKLEGHY